MTLSWSPVWIRDATLYCETGVEFGRYRTIIRIAIREQKPNREDNAPPERFTDHLLVLSGVVAANKFSPRAARMQKKRRTILERRGRFIVVAIDLPTDSPDSVLALKIFNSRNNEQLSTIV